MVTGQASNRAAGGAGNPISSLTAQNLLNLLELSNSDLTTSMGESLPVTEMLRDTLMSVLGNVRPDLLAHSQRVAFLCHGVARQCGWTSRKISILVIAALLHEVGSIILPADFPFWDLTSSPIEEHSRRVTVDVLAACHADSELLEILILSQNFRYRNPVTTESEQPKPAHVIQGAAILNFANLFDAVRHRENGKHDVAEIIAALKTLAEMPEEQRVVEGMEEWLSGRDPLIEKFELNSLQQGELGMDEEMLSIVHATFLEILFELNDLEEKFDGFFILDATGRFLLWNYGCQERLGKTMREMRNKHWTNQLMGYCNEEGLAFSDSQTPLYQTLETAKPAHLQLCLKDPEENLVETDVDSVPIMGRDGLLMGIVEIHRVSKRSDEQEEENPFTPEWIGDLVDTIHNLDDGAEPIAEVPELDEKYLVALEQKLGIAGVISPIDPAAPARTNLGGQLEEETYSEPEASDSSVEEATDTIETEDVSADAITPEFSEEEAATTAEPENVELTSPEESEPQQAEESRTEPENAETHEDNLELASSEDLDELFDRFDALVTEEELPEEDDEGSLTLSAETTVPVEEETSPPAESSETVDEVEATTPPETSSEPEPVVEESLADEPVEEVLEEQVETSASEEITSDASVQEETIEPPSVEEPEDEEVVEESVAATPDPVIEDSAPVDEVVPPQESSVEEEPPALLEEQVSETPNEEAPVLEEQILTEPEIEEPVTEEETLSESEPPSEVEEESTAVEPVAEVDEETLEEMIEETSAPETNEAVESGVPQTIEMPAETQSTETTEVPSPDPGQTDPFAQPVSRKEWDAFVEHLIDPHSPDHETVSVLFLDVDHFKAINEGFGRQIGTDLLTEISRRLSQACGKRELSCRYGGEQFAIACPGISLDKARKRGDQFRKLIDRTRFDVLPFHSLTVSVGVTTYEDGDDLTEIMNRAEHGLYQAKSSGRNCVVAVSSEDIQNEIATAEETMSDLVTKEFEIETHFEAMIASDMIVYKLGGFLYDMHAKLLHVDRRHVSLRVGKKGFLPYWGRQDDDRPVLIDLELAEGWGKERNTLGKLANTRINVRIRPDGWVRNQETFLTRAHFVLRELKGYFVTN